MVVSFFAAFSEERGRGGRPRSNRTIALTHRVLSMAMAHAVRTGVLARNPAEGARDDLPRLASGTSTSVWTPEQLGTFLMAMVDDRLYGLWVLAATTGMRRGELCGLRWNDVDLDDATVTVCRARVMVHGVPTETTPKTDSGARIIGLDPTTVTVLRSHLARQEAERRGCPAGCWAGDGHVFADEVGRPLIPEYVSKAFKRHVDRLRLPPIRLHDTRHSHATALQMSDVA